MWQAACDAIGMPECPLDLSEMQYAKLIFGKGCNYCDRRDWVLFLQFRLRLCCLCQEEKLGISTIYCMNAELIFGSLVEKYVITLHHDYNNELLTLLPSAPPYTQTFT
ncbi:uncharacterized protein FOMMEDRAFT_143360 [Fomitiporia mediterranea MF3/22]|uniref:uncharacterized protein n=1 Tax=Fomitiporia mediterranea (strain MF3/22) TaxID=694068 RepID=UPI000440906A|nr:uncharacterized protein FOMMEDRAFT_143360 [Fomitiporia mediterranea MF3/22]EJC98323.1 hypothetical protein FOMMEDRAFT_143360 [Fomitiporia mediterranea MF3/22]